MQTICNLFYILLFVSLTGGIYTILSLAVNRILHFTPPLSFGICGIIAYLLPLPTPGLYLVSPKATSWIPEYCILCGIWFCGVILLLFYDTAKAVLARRGIRNCRPCEDGYIKNICARCAGLSSLKRMPLLCFGTLDDPACVVGILRPAVILNQKIIEQLTEEELTAVLCHELNHIKREHLLWGRIYDYACILNWLNPFVWIAKSEFAVHCELDCDRSTLSCLKDRLAPGDYAGTMIRLLELAKDSRKAVGWSALGFLFTKRRIMGIMDKPTKVQKVLAACLFACVIAAVVLFSRYVSRGYFYPYPANQGLPEYNACNIYYS